VLGLLAADTRDAYGDVENVFLPVGIGVFALVAGAIVLMVVLGRRRSEAESRANNIPLEAGLVAVLVVTAGFLVAVSFRAEERVGAAEADATLRVRLVAAKWRWRFEYPQQGVVVQGRDGEMPSLVVPAGTEIEFEGVSLDVIHAFWVPEVRFQRQLFPQRPTRFAMTFPETGTLSGGRCSFYCGLRHQDMRFLVDVRSQSAFRAWAAHEAAG
jgi:heme/copper-type cytochrome/quinol oxidase subunit 2